MSLRDLIPFGNRSRGSNVPVRVEERREANPFLRLHEEMNRVFEDFLPDFFGRNSLMTGNRFDWGFSPDISVKEDKKEIQVRAEIPGVEEKDLDVRIENNVLTIRGEKREESSKEEGNCHYSECRYGSFQRSLPLSTEIQADQVEARFNKGVLTVRLPKVKESEPGGRRIPVTVA